MSTATRWLLACLLVLVQTLAAGADTTRVVVDTVSQTLTVMRGPEAILSLEGIAIGRAGVSGGKYRGDNRTPLGRYSITSIRDSDRFHRFIALSYPNDVDAERALDEGAIDRATRDRIVAAIDADRPPPQNTVLGGHIGIHGLGGGDPDIHATLNWTRGCVALTNAQVDQLLPWLRIGMVVEIR